MDVSLALSRRIPLLPSNRGKFISDLLRIAVPALCILPGTFASIPPLHAQTLTGTVSVGANPYALATNPATGKIYVVNQAGNSLSVIDGTGNTVTTLAVGNSPGAVGVNPTTNKAYVANATDGTVSVIDGTTNTVTATIPVGSDPIAVAVNPVTGQIYVVNDGNSSNSVSVIDGSTNVVAATIAVGEAPFSIALNPITNRIYVTNYNDGTVSVIDGTSNSVAATVNVGTHPDGIAMNAITNQVYVGNDGSSSVSVIDGATNAVTNVTVGSHPYEIAVDPVTNKTYVCIDGNGSVSVIDGATNAVTSVPVGGYPEGIAVNSLTNQIYVANQSSNVVNVIDGSTNTVVNVNVGNSPGMVAINPFSNKVYVANNADNTVGVINGAVNKLPATIGVGANPLPIVVNPVTNQIYVGNVSDNSVSAIDGATNAVTATVGVGSNPESIAVNPVTNQIFVGNVSDNTVSVIDGVTHAVIATVGVGTTPYGIAANPVTNHIYVANVYDGTVSVIDGATNTVAATVLVGSYPYAIGVNTATNQAYVVNLTSNNVSVIDGTTNTVTTTVDVGTEPYAIAVNSVTNQIYVVNDGSGSVSVIDGATNTVTTTVPVGSDPFAIALNAATNQIYVTNGSGSGVSVIDGATNTVIATVPAVYSDDLAVNPVTNQIYVASEGGNDISVIDGATNTVISVAAGIYPVRITVNPVTNQIYASNEIGTSVGMIDADGTGGQQTVPIFVNVVAPDVSSDPLTIALPNSAAGTPFLTQNLAPTLTATVSSAYATSPLYSADDGQTITNPPPTALYYQVDGGSGAWRQATIAAAAGANPASFSIPLAAQTLGTHTVYLFAAYGSEGTPAIGGFGSGNSPETSNLAAFVYEIQSLMTTTTLTADTNPQTPSANVTFTATVSAPTGVPAGTVSFFDSFSGTAVLLGTAPLSGSTASYQTQFSVAGDHPITAVYGGSPTYLGSTGSLTETIASPQAGVSPSSLTFGDQALGTTSSPHTVTVTNPGVTILTISGITLSGINSADFSQSTNCSTVAAGGSCTITVTFTPSALGERSATLTVSDDASDSPQTVALTGTGIAASIVTTTGLTASGASIAPGQPLTLTATVSPAGATGTVSFYNGTTLLGTSPLSNGVAAYTISSLAPGTTNSLTATYSGDSNSLPSTSTPVTVTVAPLSFTFTVSGASTISAAPGQAASYSFLVAPTYSAYPGTVTFSVTGLPAAATAAFAPVSVAANGGMQTIRMTVQLPSSTARNRPPDPFGGNTLPALSAFLLLPLAFSRKLRSKTGAGLFCLLLLLGATLASMSGCGVTGSGFLNQRPQTYTLTVTATSGPSSDSQSVTLNVQ